MKFKPGDKVIWLGLYGEKGRGKIVSRGGRYYRFPNGPFDCMEYAYTVSIEDDQVQVSESNLCFDNKFFKQLHGVK